MKKTNCSAFTLVEIMVAALILFAVLGSLMTAFLHLYKASTMTSLYSELHSDIRHSVDLIGRDVTCASGVSAYPATNDITLTCQLQGGPALVRYYVQGRKLYRSVDGAGAQVVGDNIENASFLLFTRGGASTVLPAEAALVESSIHASAGSTEHRAYDLLQVRVLMRNSQN